MRFDTNCLTDWADEFDGNQSDFSFLSDLIAYVDDLVTAEPQLVRSIFGLFKFLLSKERREGRVITYQNQLTYGAGIHKGYIR